MTTLRLALAALVLTVTALVGCGGPVQSAVAPGPAIPGLNLSAKWYSQPFGDLQLVQTGANVRGTYEDPRGPDHNGTLRGTIEGDLLHLEWIKPGNPAAALFPQRGKAWLRISRDGRKLAGKWGFETAEDGGEWTAERSSYK